MAQGQKTCIASRLRKQGRGKKGKLWTHFSLFEVHDNILENEINELEGLFRLIYRKDPQTNKLNVQKKYTNFKPIRENELSRWEPCATCGK